MKATIFLIALIVCASALTADQKPRPKSRNIMKVFAEVEQTLKNGGPLDIVANVLAEFEHDATEEQAAHDLLRTRANAECAAEFEFRSKEVGDATGALKQGQLTLDGATDQKNRATADLSFTRKVLAESRHLLVVSAASREAEVTAFAEYQAAYEFNAAQMDEVVEFVDAFIAGESSFVQIVKQTHKILRNAIKLGAAEKFATLMSIFAQLSTGESDNEFLEQLRNVVARVRSEIEDEWNNVQAAELQSQSDYEALVASTEENITTLENNQGELETALANLNRTIVEQTGIVAAATAKRDRNQRLWDEAAAYCATGEDQYLTSTQSRRDELDLLDNLRAKVTSRWGDFEDIEKERIRQERARKN